MDALRLMRARGIASIEVRAESSAPTPAVHGAAGGHGLVGRRLQELVPGRRRRGLGTWPAPTREYRRATRRFDPAPYALRTAAAPWSAARRPTALNPVNSACIPRKVMKGGSHLCAPDYCRRYRPAARMPQPIDTSTCAPGIPLRRPPGPVRHQGGVSDSSALAEARRIVPAPPIMARRQGATPSISVSSEKLRNVLITTISPSSEDIVEGGRDRDGVNQVGGDQDFQPEEQGPAEGLAQDQVSLCRPARPPHGNRGEH